MNRNRFPITIVAMVMSAALMLAPLLALLFSPAAGLLVMAVALGTSVLMLLEVRSSAPYRMRHVLGAIVALDTVLAAICVIAAVWWIANR